MKNKHLIAAIEFARRLGCIVTRQHADGQTLVTVTDKSGNQSAAKVYKTGSSNPQARYIKNIAKWFKLVDTGVMVRREDGAVFFYSEGFNVLYRWHEESKEWRVWMARYDTNPLILRFTFRGNWCYAKVDVNKLNSGVKYYD